MIRPWVASRALEAVRHELDAARVLWGPYRAMLDVVTAHQHRQHPVLADVQMPGGQIAITGRAPMRFNGAHTEPGVVPRLGEHTSDVLADVLGLNASEIGRLLQQGTIAETSADPALR